MTSEELRKKTEEIKVGMEVCLKDVQIRRYVKLFGQDFADEYTDYVKTQLKGYDEIFRLLDLNTEQGVASALILYDVAKWTTFAFYILIRSRAIRFDEKGTLSEDLKKENMD